MENIDDKLRKLEGILKERNAPVLKYLNPGLQEKEIIVFFVRKGIRINPAIIPLYRWHNGIDFPPEGIYQNIVEIMPMGVFYSLEEVSKSWEDIISWKYFPTPEDFLPIFGSGEDDLYLLKISSGEIFYMSPATGNFLGEFNFRSLDVMFDFIIECYLEKVFTIDPEKGLDFDDVKYIEKQEKYERL